MQLNVKESKTVCSVFYLINAQQVWAFIYNRRIEYLIKLRIYNNLQNS